MFGTTGSFTAVLTVADSPNATNSDQVAIAVGNSTPVARPTYSIGDVVLFNEETSAHNEDGTVTGAHLTSELILHLPKPLVELPAKV
jgi:autotransporter adhesin